MSSRIAILASGAGTTAAAFIRACAADRIDATVVLVICNKEDAAIFERVARLNSELGLRIAIELVNAKSHPAAVHERVLPGGQTVAEEKAIAELLRAYRIDVVMLMGYLRRIGPTVVHDYGWRSAYTSPYQARMLNTHPGLLPETIGLWGVHVQEHLFEKGLTFGGCTVHIVSEKYDEGPTIAEHQLDVAPNDTAATFFERVKALQNETLPADLRAFIVGREAYSAKEGRR